MTTVTQISAMFMHIAKYTVIDSDITALYAIRGSSDNNRNDDIWLLVKVINRTHFKL